MGDFGSFYDTQTQFNVNPGGAIPIMARQTDASATSGISVANASRITVSKDGVYNLQFSAQVTKTDSGIDVVYIWLNKNGVPVADTNSSIRLDGNNDREVAAWNFLVDMKAGDHLELMWSSSDASTELLYDQPPGIPAIPSQIVTMTQVGEPVPTP